jgi:hypothetical protein
MTENNVTLTTTMAPITTITGFTPGFESCRMLARRYHNCLKKAKDLNEASQVSRSGGENSGMKMDALGCSLGGVGAVGSIMSSAKESQDNTQKLQIHIYNRSPYVIIPQRLKFNDCPYKDDSYRTISMPGPLKPSESGEIEIDCHKDIRKKESSFDGADIHVYFSVVSVSGRAIWGHTQWIIRSGAYLQPWGSDFGPEAGMQGFKTFEYYTGQTTRFKKNLYLQGVTTNDRAYPQFGVATSSSPIGQSDSENSHLTLEIVPWEIYPEAFCEGPMLGNCDVVRNIGGVDGGLGPHAFAVGSKIWKQVLRDSADNSQKQNTRGFASAVVPFGNLAQGGAKMVAGLISGARGLTRFQKSKIPVNINVKNMTACTMSIASFEQTENGHLESHIIPAGEDGNFLLTDDIDNTEHPEVSFFFATDDSDDNDSRITLTWENSGALCRLWKVQCYDDDGNGSELQGCARKYEDKHIWIVESGYFLVPTPKSANILVCCTSANNKAEQDLTLTFAQ